LRLEVVAFVVGVVAHPFKAAEVSTFVFLGFAAMFGVSRVDVAVAVSLPTVVEFGASWVDGGGGRDGRGSDGRGSGLLATGLALVVAVGFGDVKADLLLLGYVGAAAVALGDASAMLMALWDLAASSVLLWDLCAAALKGDVFAALRAHVVVVAAKGSVPTEPQAALADGGVLGASGLQSAVVAALGLPCSVVTALGLPTGVIAALGLPIDVVTALGTPNGACLTLAGVVGLAGLTATHHTILWVAWIGAIIPCPRRRSQQKRSEDQRKGCETTQENLLCAITSAGL